MLLTCIFSIALQEPVIEIPAGYYTVNELAGHLSRQHIRVNVVNSGADVYAIRFEKKPWKDVRAALVADERLVISQKDGVWHIERSILDKNGEALALKRYLDFARGEIHAVFGTAADAIRRVEALPQAERNAAYDEYPPKFFKDDPLKTGANQLIYLVGASKDQAFLTVTAPAFLTDPKNGVPFGQLRSSSLGDAVHMLFPTGGLGQVRFPFIDWEKASDEEKERVAREFKVGAKLLIDPLTLTIGSRTMLSVPQGRGMTVSFGPAMKITTRFIRVEPRPEDVWDKPQMAGQQKRLVASNSVLGSAAALKEIEVPERPIRISEALLRVADKAKNDLVCYVGAFSDTPLTPRAKTSLTQIYGDVTDERFDPALIRLSIRERVEPEPELGKKLPLRPLTRFSLASLNGTWIVRDEMRFLDGIGISPNGMPTAIENKRVADQKPSLEEVAAHVDGLGVGKWQTSIFSSNYLHTCNPVAFYPFARALVRSEVLRKAVATGKVEMPLSALEPLARTALTDGMRDAGLLMDTTAPGDMFDPVAGLSMVSPSTLITVTVEGGAHEFRLKNQGRGEAMLWAAWVRL